MDQYISKEWVRKCPGVGAWFTSDIPNIPYIKGSIGSRIEYNINDGILYFNSSAVDSINANFNASYTECPDNIRKCTINLDECPVPIINNNGVKECPAPKFWDDNIINECGTDGFGTQFKLTPKNLAGCGYGDANYKEECHKWWSTNRCAQQWLNYLQKNKSGTCQQYGWAYDEKKWKSGDTFDLEGNPPDNTGVNPLIECPLNKGSLNIEILKIL